MRFFSSSKWKSSYSFSSNSPPQEILLVRISSFTKSKTQGNFLEQPRVFLFVKKEFFTREKSSWEGGGQHEQWVFLFIKEEILTKKKILAGERRKVESPGRISQNDILLKFQWSFLLRQKGNPHIPSPSPTPQPSNKEIHPVRISSDKEKNSW